MRSDYASGVSHQSRRWAGVLVAVLAPWLVCPCAAYADDHARYRHRVGLAAGVLVAGQGSTDLGDSLDLPMAGSPGYALAYVWRPWDAFGFGLTVEKWMLARTMGAESGGFLERYGGNFEAVFLRLRRFELAARLGLACSVWLVTEYASTLKRNYNYLGIGGGIDGSLMGRLWVGRMAMTVQAGGGADWGTGEEWADVDERGTHAVASAWLRIGIEFGLGEEP